MPDGSSVLIAATGTDIDRIYAKLLISSDSSVTSSMKFTEGTTTDLLKLSGLFIVDANNIKVLMFSTTTKITSIASIDFSALSITYLKKLPAITTSVYLGKFVSADKFYIAVYYSYGIFNIATSIPLFTFI